MGWSSSLSESGVLLLSSGVEPSAKSADNAQRRFELRLGYCKIEKEGLESLTMLPSIG